MMLPLLPNVDVRQAARFLRRGYELERASRCLVSAIEVGREMGFGEKSSRDICAYLAEKGFINQLGPNCSLCAYLLEKGMTDRLAPGCGFRLSSRGLDEIEWSFASPGFFYGLICEEDETH
jgi:hypothetical protein